MRTLFVLIAASCLAGCATLREADPRAVDDSITKIRNADSSAHVADRIDDVRSLYYEQMGLLKKDIVGSGDAVTGLGIGAGIVAASTGVAADVLKGIGILGGSMGVWDLRYKPAQQRQLYVSATQALGCMSDRVRQLDTQVTVFARRGRVNLAAVADSPAKIAAVRNIEGSTDIAYREVLAVHRRLEEKLFAAVTTQSIATIRDNLVKEAVAEQQNADRIKDESPSTETTRLLSQSANIRLDEAGLTAAEKARQADLLLAQQKQLVKMLADGATFQTDMRACGEILPK